MARALTRHGMRLSFLLLVAVPLGCASGTSPNGETPTPVFYTPDQFVMGVDLSYVNQILDHGGAYSDSMGVRDPYAIFADHGANVARFRLWHDPSWVRTQVYDDPSAPLYSGLEDVARAIEAARAQGLEVNVDFHYSDIWADPGRQNVPAAWLDISDLKTLEDSVYNYTRSSLEYLEGRGLLPEMVQVGNETNCGMLRTGAGESFPDVNACEGNWEAQGRVLNAGIRAVRDVSSDIQIIIHIAQPENVPYFFDNIMTTGGVTDFDILGFSYYSPWSDEPLASISDHIADWRQAYGKAVMIMETAYPWTLQNADGYGNIFGESSLVQGYSASNDGQLQYMIDLVQEVMDGGGTGVFYWEPAWITSNMKDLWGTGSAWENNALFDFGGRANIGMRHFTHAYEMGS